MHGRRQHEPSRGLLVATADDEAKELIFYYSPLYLYEQRQNLFFRPVFIPRFRVSFSEYQKKTQVINGLVCLYSTDRLSLVNLYTREVLHLVPAPSPSRRLGRVINTYYYFFLEAVGKVYNLLSITYLCRNKYCDLDKCKCITYFLEAVAQRLELTGPISSYCWKQEEWVLPNEAFKKPSFCANGFLYWLSGFVAHSYAIVAFFIEFDQDYYTRAIGFQPIDPGCSIAQFRGLFALADLSHDETKMNFHYLSHGYKGGQICHDIESVTIDLPQLLTGNSLVGKVVPVGNLANGDVLLAKVPANHPYFSTPVCSYDYETNSYTPFQDIGAFPPLVASMSAMELASCLTCLEENLTPLHVLLGTGS